LSGARTSRSEDTYQALLGDILRGRWPAGTTLSSYALATELEVSRTPVLEAMRRLQHDGLVEVIPQVGCRITRPTGESLRELFTIREALEGRAAAAAAVHADESALRDLASIQRRLTSAAVRGDRGAVYASDELFHVRVAEATGMPRLAETVRGVWALLRHQAALLPPTAWNAAPRSEEHEAIVTALRFGDPERARAAAERHVRRGAARLLPARDDGVMQHAALRYHDLDGMVAGAVPYLVEGLDRGERVLAVMTGEGRAALTQALGPRAGEVEFWDAESMYERTARAVLALQRFTRRGRGRARLFGDVASAAGHMTADEWLRYESVVDLACTGLPVSLLCGYHEGRIPAEILALLERTHRHVHAGGEVHESPAYEDPADVLHALDAQPLAEPQSPTEDCVLAPDLRDVRAHVRDSTRRAGLRGRGFEDVALAVEEAAADVLAHSEGATLRSWTADGRLVHELRAPDGRLAHPLVSFVQSRPEAPPEAHGLWLAQLLCDAVEVRANGDGLVVRLHSAV